jgi:hypothetical protein
MGVEKVFSIMLTDNYRAISLTRKMGFCLEYLDDNTVKGTLDLSQDILEAPCAVPEAQKEHPEIKKPESAPTQKEEITEAKEKKELKKEEAQAAPA